MRTISGQRPRFLLLRSDFIASFCIFSSASRWRDAHPAGRPFALETGRLPKVLSDRPSRKLGRALRPGVEDGPGRDPETSSLAIQTSLPVSQVAVRRPLASVPSRNVCSSSAMYSCAACLRARSCRAGQHAPSQNSLSSGIGPGVITEGVAALQAVAGLDGGLKIETQAYNWGSERYLRNGAMMSADGLKVLEARDYNAILVGPVGDPLVADHITLWGMLLPIRQGFDQYINLRPVRPVGGRQQPAGR